MAEITVPHAATESSLPAPLLRATDVRRDLAAFEDVMRRYNQRLYRLAFSLVGESAEAEDVLQDSYVLAYEHLASFAGRSGLCSWLASIVRNQAIDHVRIRQARRAAVSLEVELDGPGDGRDGVLERAAAPASQSSLELSRSREEAKSALEQAIAALPMRFRAVFMLREVEGLSVEETARYLGIPAATVKSRDHRARKLLQAELGPEFREHARDTFEFQRERCDRIVAGVLAVLARL